MPKYGIHQIVLEKAISRLNSGNNRSAHAASDIELNKGLANLGAIGPDLFFWSPDYDYVDKLYQLYKNMSEVIDIHNKVVEPVRKVKEEVGEVTEEALSVLGGSTVELIKKTVKEIKETESRLRSTLANGLFSGVITIDDWISSIGKVPKLTSEFFTLFTPPMQDQLAGQMPRMDVRNWYWFDILHYRKVGRLAYEMKKKAFESNDPKLKAYTYGYLSHIATDVIGHAYVNQIVGGPYRINVQRHITVENFMDTWAYKHYYNGENISKTLLTHLELPNPANLPDSIINHIDQSIRDTYRNGYPTRLGNPGFLTQAQIRESYEIFYNVLSIMEKMVISYPDEPFSGVQDVLAHAVEDLFEAPPNPPPLPSRTQACDWDQIFSFGLTDDSRKCYEEFFDETEEWMNYAGELMLWTIETSLDLLDLILAAIASIPISTLLALLYGTQLLLYDLYLTARSVLSDMGFFYPELFELDSSKGVFLTTTALSCSYKFKYPMTRNNTFSHLICPVSELENPSTVADFFQLSELVKPNQFIEKISFSIPGVEAYALSQSPAETRELERNNVRMGNAVDFTSWLISSINNNLTNREELTVFADWNLDSDRGYGYKSWDGSYDTVKSKIVNEIFTNETISPSSF